MAKCAECGYLSVRNRDTSCLGEATSDFRENGVVTLGREYGRNQYPLHEPIPFCFARRPYLGEATKSIKDKANPFQEVQKIIQKDIECEEFTNWQQGFTPKEHREMMDKKAILKWQAEREEADRNWQMKESAENRKWRFREFIVAVIALVIVVAASVVGAMIERGILFN